MKEVITKTEETMKRSIESLENELNTIRAGRANPAILDRIHADFYGTATPINQMANISVSENRILVIQPWDKNTLKEIERAILTSDLGIAPNNDGTVIRIVFPQPTEERRSELVRDAKAIGEDIKVQIRNARRAANDELKKIEDSGSVSEDDVKRKEEEVQKLTDEYVEKIDKVVTSKEKEIMAI